MLVGVFPALRPCDWSSYRLPHALGVFPTTITPCVPRFGPAHPRGGVSSKKGAQAFRKLSFSGPWGCFLGPRVRARGSPVLPTLVGVFPTLSTRIGRRRRFPHSSGGVSQVPHSSRTSRPSSPRSWGCFQPHSEAHKGDHDLPAPAGVFPRATVRRSRPRSLPRASGGVSLAIGREPRKDIVLPTPVGVFQ